MLLRASPGGALSIRESVLGDAEAIARVSVESWRTSYRGTLPDSLLAGLDTQATIREVAYLFG